VDLTPKEFALLLLLARRAGEVVPRRDILAEVWQLPYGGSDKTVDVHVSWLRRKLGETGSAPRYLHSVRGVGVRLIDPG
jgi:DNA-binding response OmpR family regulator